MKSALIETELLVDDAPGRDVRDPSDASPSVPKASEQPKIVSLTVDLDDQAAQEAAFRGDEGELGPVSARTRRRLPRHIGFQPRHPALYRAYNIAVSLLILAGAAPVLLVITVAVFLTQGREVFYRGPRLGKGEKVFQIYKFRTLNTAAAASVTKDRTLPKNSGLETPLGKFLRDTRLDELPQIFNVLKGDMNLCGPRPVRPEIAVIERTRIPGYETRFTVKPGLVGPAQALMSHGASKRIRALFNNTACRRPVVMSAEITLLAAIGWAVLRRSVTELYFKIVKLALRLGRKMRGLVSRIADLIVGVESYDAVEVELPGVAMLQKVTLLPGQVVEIPALPRLPASKGDGEEGVVATLVVSLPNGGMRRARVTLSPEEKPGHYTYTATSAASEYFIERYLLGLTVLGPTRRRDSDGHRVRFSN